MVRRISDEWRRTARGNEPASTAGRSGVVKVTSTELAEAVALGRLQFSSGTSKGSRKRCVRSSNMLFSFRQGFRSLMTKDRGR